jgi:NitT/TauT family transport system ATP-binding protein
MSIRYLVRRDGTYFNAVREVSFEIGANELLCVVGPSGCGKSTILNAIAGLLPYFRGSVTIAGVAVRGPDPKCAVVFQRPALLPWRSVTDNVTYGMRLRGASKNEAEDRAAQMLKLVGLRSSGRSYPYELSGGMQQRVNLARALATDPDVLLLDEPFASLDAQQREILQDELLRIWETTHKCGLFITHQIDEAVLMGDRVLVMSAGPESTIRDVVEIDLPRPRDRATRREGRFAEYVDHIWGLLRNELV